MERISFTKSNIERIKAPTKGRKTVYDKSRQKLCVRVTEKGAKTFYYVTKFNGKTEWNKLGRFPEMEPAVARVRADQKAGEYAEGRNPAQEKREEKSEWNVETAYEMYRKKNELKGGKSLEIFDGYWRHHFSPWANKRLSQVSGGMAEKLQDRILENRSGATANRVIATGRALFNFAIKRKASGFDGPNPFDGIEKRPERRRKNKLRMSQVPAFFNAVKTVSPVMQDFILLALWTGRRAGDLKTMRWVDLDIDSGTWLIPETKADEPQEVALSLPAIEILVRRKKEGKGKWVFPSRAKSGHIEEYKKAWQQVRDEAGLDGLRLHDLRRSLSSFAQENRISATVAGAQLGHKDPSTTMKHYTDIALYVQRDAVNVVAKVILEAAKNE
jgi:integrase